METSPKVPKRILQLVEAYETETKAFEEQAVIWFASTKTEADRKRFLSSDASIKSFLSRLHTYELPKKLLAKYHRLLRKNHELLTELIPYVRK